MSSVLRYIAQPVQTQTKFSPISTPSYNSGLPNISIIPIPFIVVNQTLDIEITEPTLQTFINNGTTPEEESDYQAKVMGGKTLVTDIGPNFRTYLNNLIGATEGSPYSGELLIYINPTMTKAQIAQPNGVSALEVDNVFGINTQPPSSDGYVGGLFSNNYYTTWIFYSPLTVRYVASTGYKYITFTTHYDNA